MEAPIGPLDGPILKLPWKLDRVLRDGSILPKGVEDEIPLIKRDLGEIISILSNLDDHHATAMKVSCWRKEVRELSYDMEDFIDQYEHATAVPLLAGSVPRRKTIQKRKSKTSTLFRLRERLKQRLWMANKIREFSVRTQEALQRHSMYNLDVIAVSGSTYTRCADACSTSSHSTPCGKENAYVGISAAMEKLQELLMVMHDEGHRKLKVVSIVGVGGIGKTTLANEIYSKLGQQFECRAFVRTSQKPDMRRIFVSMLSQIRPHQPPDNWTVHSLISIIRTHLQDKRYLIIVEDICATSTWDIVKCALPDSNCCSRILTTTETEDLALLSCDHDPKYVYKMQPLGEDDSRKLFFSSLFGTQHECPPDLSETSYNVISKCGGFPLAIVTVAGVLSSKPGIQDQWDYVNKSIDYSLLTNPTSEGMKQILDLSYNNLPQNLKACILYTGLYEEDTIIWKDDLVNQWIAEGFIQPSEGRDMKEIASSLFDRLISRKLILPVDINKNGEVLSCVVHRMVLNLVIRYKSIEENFVTAIHHSQATMTLADKVRRLSLQFGNTEDAILPTNMRLSQVRTLVFWGVFKCSPTIVQFHLLQVLILHFWADKDSISFDLTRISELFRLRYLKLTSNVTLELGNQIRGLQSLETLTIDARVNAVPSDIVRLPGLLHLGLPAETDLPNGIGHMTLLRTFGYFDLCSNSMENVQSLSMLTNLRDLQLTCSTVLPENLENIMQLLLTLILGRLSNLKSLTLVPRASTNAKSADEAGATGMTISNGLSSLSSAPADLQSLEISPRICIFYWLPKWIGQLQKLCILKIGLRKIDRDDVDVVRGLPALAVLSLYSQAKPEARIVVGKTGFPVIKYFKFKCCDPLLKFEEGAMPNLHRLKLAFNAYNADQQITIIPVGIRYLSNLKEVSAKIGGAGPDESHRRAIELAFRDEIRVHARCERVNIQCVKQIIGGKDDDQYILSRVEDYGTLQQYKIKDEEDSDEHVESMQKHSGQVADTDADNRSTLSELHIFLLLNKLDNQHGDITRSIPIVEVYSHDPWNLESSGTTHGGLLLFFRPLLEGRSVVPAKTPSGYWKLTGFSEYIYSDKRHAIGMKRTMEFYHDHLTSCTKTKWRIKELLCYGAAGKFWAPMMPGSEMSICQLYTDLVANPDCIPAGVQHDKNLSIKQNKIQAEEPSINSGVVQTSSKQADNKRKSVVTSASPDTDDCYTPGGSTDRNRSWAQNTQETTTCPRNEEAARRGSTCSAVTASGQYSTTCVTTLESTAATFSRRTPMSRDPSIAGGGEAAGLPLSIPHAHRVISVETVRSSGSLTTRSQVVMSNPDNDGYSWTTYSQKNIPGLKYPISYYHCAHRITQGCIASKRVQRKDDADTSLWFDAIYYGQHTCDHIAHSTDNISSLARCTTTGSTVVDGSTQAQVQEPSSRQRGDALEEEIMATLGTEGATPAEQAPAMALLRQATRENQEVRRQLCTPRLLAALRPMLLSPDADVQVNAVAAVVNLSLEPENKVRIVRSGAVSPLVDVLRGGHPEARDHAAGAMYSLAVEDENRAAIGVLGAIPPLLELFAGAAGAAAGHRARREAGMALYHVSLSGMNRSKIARAPGAVRTLLAAAEARDRGSEGEAAALRRLAVMILANLAGCPDGRAALMDGGAVAAVVRLMRNGSVAPRSAEQEYCISTLYGMSRGSMRFRELARAAGVEAALQPVAEGDGGVGRDLARRTLRAMRGEDDDAPVTGTGLLGRQWDDGSVVSEGLVSVRRPPHRSNYAGPSGSNTTQF